MQRRLIHKYSQLGVGAFENRLLHLLSFIGLCARQHVVFSINANRMEIRHYICASVLSALRFATVLRCWS